MERIENIEEREQIVKGGKIIRFKMADTEPNTSPSWESSSKSSYDEKYNKTLSTKKQRKGRSPKPKEIEDLKPMPMIVGKGRVKFTENDSLLLQKEFEDFLKGKCTLPNKKIEPFLIKIKKKLSQNFTVININTRLRYMKKQL